MLDCFDFYETETAFFSKSIQPSSIKTDDGKLVVKAHEKMIFLLPGDLILAKVHRDNQCAYPFSKLDFLSHKLQELIYPNHVPKLYSANFEDADAPAFILEQIPLDKLHIAYNVRSQRNHQLLNESLLL